MQRWDQYPCRAAAHDFGIVSGRIQDSEFCNPPGHENRDMERQRDSCAPGASAGAAGAAAAIAQATKASGVIVRISAADFMRIIELNDEPLVVETTGGFFRVTYRYLTSYRGLAFYTKSDARLTLPAKCQVVQANRIWVPG